MSQKIYVLDRVGSEHEWCGCGRQSMFVIGFNSVSQHLCEDCIAELAKRIIDGLR